MIKQSDTFIQDLGRVHGPGSRLTCECGRNYKIGQLVQIKWPNDKMELTRESYCCPHCARQGDIVILIEDEYNPPVHLIDQANGQYPTRHEYSRSKRKSKG